MTYFENKKIRSKSFFNVSARVLKKYSIPPNYSDFKSWVSLREYLKNCVNIKAGDFIWNYKDQAYSEVLDVNVIWHNAVKINNHDNGCCYSKIKLVSMFKYPEVFARVKCSQYDDGLIVFKIKFPSETV